MALEASDQDALRSIMELTEIAKRNASWSGAPDAIFSVIFYWHKSVLQQSLPHLEKIARFTEFDRRTDKIDWYMKRSLDVCMYSFTYLPNKDLNIKIQ